MSDLKVSIEIGAPDQKPVSVSLEEAREFLADLRRNVNQHTAEFPLPVRLHPEGDQLKDVKISLEEARALIADLEERIIAGAKWERDPSGMED